MIQLFLPKQISWAPLHQFGNNSVTSRASARNGVDTTAQLTYCTSPKYFREFEAMVPRQYQGSPLFSRHPEVNLTVERYTPHITASEFLKHPDVDLKAERYEAPITAFELFVTQCQPAISDACGLKGFFDGLCPVRYCYYNDLAFKRQSDLYKRLYELHKKTSTGETCFQEALDTAIKDF